MLIFALVLGRASYLEGVVYESFELGGTPIVLASREEEKEGSATGDAYNFLITGVTGGNIFIKGDCFLKDYYHINLMLLLKENFLRSSHHRTVKRQEFVDRIIKVA